MWGTDLTTTVTGEGQAAVFVAVDHCSAVYRLRLVGHRIGAYAARATGESCSSRMAAGGLKPCRSISQVAL
jgi:hypothetical protein